MHPPGDRGQSLTARVQWLSPPSTRKGECWTRARGGVSGPPECWVAGLAEAEPGLGSCNQDSKETPRAGSKALRPRRVGPRGKPGGASRVASAGLGRAHEGHVGVEELARRGPPSCSAAAAACRRWRYSGWGTCPAPQPGTQRTGLGLGRDRGRAPGGALLARLSTLVSGPSTRCGKLGGFVREWLGMRAAEEGASAKRWRGGKTGMGRHRWEHRGASEELPPAERQRLAPGPARAAEFHVGGPRDAGSHGVAGQCCVRSPTPAHEHGTKTQASTSFGGVGTGSARGREGGGGGGAGP